MAKERAMNVTAMQPAVPKVETLLLEVADVVNTTLDLETILHRVAELIHRVIPYDIFAILLLNEKTQELRVRFSIGYPPEVAERVRLKVGEGITGRAALTREPVLENDVRNSDSYIQALPDVGSELAVPLIIKNRVIGVIDIESLAPGYFTEDHRRLLVLIGSRIAIGIENARLYTRTKRQARTLEVLNEVSREFTSILNLDKLLKRVGELLNRLIDYQMFSILLMDSTGTHLDHRFSIRFKETVHLKNKIALTEGLVGYAALHKEAVLVPDVSKDPRYLILNPETRSELCVPLMYNDQVIGVLDVEHTKRGYFTEDHVRTLTTLAAQVAIAIENARLYERITRQEQNLKRDLLLARELQMRLLPACCPVLGHAQLSAKFVPARTIGGDLYDFIPYAQQSPAGPAGEDARTAIAVGDVSGKGAPAALYAALASGYLRSHAGHHPNAAETLASINQSLTERQIDAQYVTMIYAIWDDQRRHLTVANSGLPLPIYCRGGRVEAVPATGTPLGLFPTATFDELEFTPDPGDLFVFFSDGISDATAPGGEMFGRCRLEQVVAQNCSGSANHVVAAIFNAVVTHTSGVEQFDDQTVVVLKVTGEGAPSCEPCQR